MVPTNMILVVMIGLAIFSRPFIAESTPTDKDSESNKTGSKGCYYKGRYHTGNWEDGCDYLCTCINPDTGYYKCRRRCPRYESLPTNCELILPPGTKCCKQPRCLMVNRHSKTMQQTLHISGGRGRIPDIFKNPKNSDKVNSTKDYNYARKDEQLNGGVPSQDINIGEAIHTLEGLTSVNIHVNNPAEQFGMVGKTELFRQNSDITMPNTRESNATENSLPPNVQDLINKERLEQTAMNESGTQEFITTTEVGVTINTESYFDNTEHNSSNSDSDTPQHDTKDGPKADTSSNGTLQNIVKESTVTTPNIIDSDVSQHDKKDMSNSDTINNGTFNHKVTESTVTTQSIADFETKTHKTDNSKSTSDTDITANVGDNNESRIKNKTNETNNSESASSKSGKDDNDNDNPSGLKQHQLINYILLYRHHLKNVQPDRRYIIPPIVNSGKGTNITKQTQRVFHKSQPKPTENSGLFRQTVPANQGVEKVQNTSERPATSAAPYINDAVTYKPIVPTYTGANISLKYKDKEWSMFVKELSEMFLEVNRMKKSNQLNTNPRRQPGELELLKPRMPTENVDVMTKSSRKHDFGNDKQQGMPLRPSSSLVMKGRSWINPGQSQSIHDCNYRGRRYRPGETWLTTCNRTCICYRNYNGRYMCERQRCPSTADASPDCRLITQSHGCCRELDCPDSKNVTSNPEMGIATDVPTAMEPSLVKYVKTPTGTIRLKQSGNGDQQWVGTFLPNVGNNTKAFCRYKGRKYVTGDVWNDGCNTCQCVNGLLARYTCRMRCPSFNRIPSGCILQVVSQQECCPILKCYGTTDSLMKVTSPTTRYSDWRPVTMATPKNTVISPFIQTFFVPKFWPATTTTTTTKTPFVQKRFDVEYSRLKNGGRILIGNRNDKRSDLRKVLTGRTETNFTDLWRRKHRQKSSRNAPRGLI